MSLAAKPAAGAASRPVSKQRLRLWLRLLLARRAIEAELRERLRVQFEMTLPQFDVMAALARQESQKDGGMTMTELSRALMVSNGNVTGIVERLVARQYVLQQASAKDRRRFNVRLTAKGAARFNDVAKAHEAWVDELLSDFKSTEAEALLTKFEGLTQTISSEERPDN
jgi:DNA-binding MarR family transcriptional regulator